MKYIEEELPNASEEGYQLAIYPREAIYAAINAERERQDRIHPAFPKELRLAIAAEEFGEIAKALQDGNGLRDEMIQTCAVLIRWIEHIDREE